LQISPEQVWSERQPVTQPEKSALTAEVDTPSDLGAVNVSRQMTRAAVRAQLYAASAQLPGNRRQRRQFAREMTATAYQAYNRERANGN